jgi:hypothetical protein
VDGSVQMMVQAREKEVRDLVRLTRSACHSETSLLTSHLLEYKP